MNSKGKIVVKVHQNIGAKSMILALYMSKEPWSKENDYYEYYN